MGCERGKARRVLWGSTQCCPEVAFVLLGNELAAMYGERQCMSINCSLVAAWPRWQTSLQPAQGVLYAGVESLVWHLTRSALLFAGGLETRRGASESGTYQPERSRPTCHVHSVTAWRFRLRSCHGFFTEVLAAGSGGLTVGGPCLGFVWDNVAMDGAPSALSVSQSARSSLLTFIVLAIGRVRASYARAKSSVTVGVVGVVLLRDFPCLCAHGYLSTICLYICSDTYRRA